MITCVRDEELTRDCEAHVRATFGHIRPRARCLFLPVLDAVRQGRWSDAWYYACQLHNGHADGSVVRREMACLLLRIGDRT